MTKKYHLLVIYSISLLFLRERSVVSEERRIGREKGKKEEKHGRGRAGRVQGNEGWNLIIIIKYCYYY